MASFQAIAATSEAIRTVLRRAAVATQTFSAVDVQHFQAAKLQQPPSSDDGLVLSIFLYRVSVSSVRRNLPPSLGPAGERYLPPIPLDLYYLVSAWAGSAQMQQQLLGFAVRALEDMTTLPSALLNDQGWRGVFRDHETVELVWLPLTPQEESDIWQVAPGSEQPSASYLARMVEIESRIEIPEYPPAQTTEFAYAKAGVS
jgi:Pvc16 N-terminal domain